MLVRQRHGEGLRWHRAQDRLRHSCNGSVRHSRSPLQLSVLEHLHPPSPRSKLGRIEARSGAAVRPFLCGLQGTKAAIEAAIIDAREAIYQIERPTPERRAQAHACDERHVRPGYGAGHTADTHSRCAPDRAQKIIEKKPYTNSRTTPAKISRRPAGESMARGLGFRRV